jgi:outer membrane biosynthesis protein TonB
LGRFPEQGTCLFCWPWRGPNKGTTVTTQDTVEFDAADLEPISTAASEEALQRVMDMSRAAAEAQAELEAQGIDPTSPAEEEQAEETPEPSEQPDESAEGEPAEEAQEPEEAEPPEEEQPEEEAEPKAEEPKPKPKPAEQPAYSRRDAVRFKADLDATRAELQQARAALQAHQASDASIISQIQEQAGSEREFQELQRKNNLGHASDQERQRLQIMEQWRQTAGPIYRNAQQQVVAAWGSAFTAAGNFDGMTDEARQQINSAADPRLALEAIHTAGLKAGTEVAQAEARAEQKKLQAEVQRLKTEVSSLKTKVVTTRPQPATPDGTTAASGPKLPPMLLEDGSLNPEFEKLAASGKLYGVEKLTG